MKRPRPLEKIRRNIGIEWYESCWAGLFAASLGSWTPDPDSPWFLPIYAACIAGATIFVRSAIRNVAVNRSVFQVRRVTPDQDMPGKGITVGMVAKVARLSDESDPARFTVALELWEDIYGRPPDYSRPFIEILTEIEVGLKGLT